MFINTSYFHISPYKEYQSFVIDCIIRWALIKCHHNHTTTQQTQLFRISWSDTYQFDPKTLTHFILGSFIRIVKKGSLSFIREALKYWQRTRLRVKEYLAGTSEFGPKDVTLDVGFRRLSEISLYALEPLALGPLPQRHLALIKIC